MKVTVAAPQVIPEVEVSPEIDEGGQVVVDLGN